VDSLLVTSGCWGVTIETRSRSLQTQVQLVTGHSTCSLKYKQLIENKNKSHNNLVGH